MAVQILIKVMKNFLKRLKKVKKSGNGYIAICPAHKDKTPSLSIGEGKDGRVLIYCHAGCTLDQILLALKMKPSDLYPEKEASVVAVYKYQDASGKDIYEIVRTGSKNFFARHKEKGKYVYNSKGIQLEPYRLTQLIETVKNGKPIFIVEGEKDCDSVAKQLKLQVTTFPFGAKWKDHYKQYFKNARVLIIPDNDKSGHDMAEGIAKKLHGITKSIRIINLPNLPEKGDISDWIEQGGTRKQLYKLAKTTKLWKPIPEVEMTEVEQAVNAMIAQFNEQFATVMINGNFLVIEPNRYDPSLKRSGIVFMSTTAFEKKFAHRKIVVNDNGNEQKSTKIWLEHPDRRDYDGVVFDPGIDHGPRYFNYWQGFDVKAKKGKTELYLQHIFENIANGDVKVYDHIIALMADAVQLRPRPGVALVIIGSQGTGKGVMLNNFGALFGRHFLHIIQSTHLLGKFNSHLSEGMIVFVDEAFWAGNKKAEGVLKGMVTEELLMIEAKGCDAYSIKNHNRLFMATNNDWAVPAGMEERRFFVVMASDRHMQDREYFGCIQKEMDEGGREALLHYLQNYDLSGIDLTDFPRTESLANQKLFNMDLPTRFWYSVLEEGKLFEEIGGNVCDRAWNDGVIATKLLYQAFLESIKDEPNLWYGKHEGFGIAIKKIVEFEKKRMNGKAHYIFPSLQKCRDQFDKRSNQQWEWDEPGGEEVDEYLEV